MNRQILTAALLTLTLAANAQVNVLIDENKDSITAETNNAEVQSLRDVLKSQQRASNTTNNTEHFNEVWSRRKFVNFAYNTVTSTITEAPANNPEVKDNEFKSNWAVGLIVGVNYKLHKPIANMCTINLDYNCIELNINHFNREKGTSYNSEENYISGENVIKRPFNEEKYDFNYGMSLGPSITIAPFTPTNSKGIDFLKFNIYFNVGYDAALLLYNVKDTNTKTSTPQNLLQKSNKLEFGHGLYTKFGISASWKGIGIGYEHRVGTNKYQSLSKTQFGEDKFKMKSVTNRIYLQIRML